MPEDNEGTADSPQQMQCRATNTRSVSGETRTAPVATDRPINHQQHLDGPLPQGDGSQPKDRTKQNERQKERSGRQGSLGKHAS